LESGEAQHYPAEIAEGQSRMTVSLPPYGSILLVGGQTALENSTTLENSAENPAPGRVLTLPTDGQWKLELDRSNALRLNRWRVASVEGDWSQLEASDESWNQTAALPLKYLDQTQKRWIEGCARDGSTPVWYRRRIFCEFVPDDLRLLIENEAILGDWSLFVNGVAVNRASFGPVEYNGSDKTACPVEKLFRHGENIIALRVDKAPEMGGLRTPLHLIGRFALAGGERRTLVALPTEANFHDLPGAGLPHFSGTAMYRRTLPGEKFINASMIELPAGFQDIAEISLDGKVLGVRAWSPYRWELPPLSRGDVEMQIAVTNTLLPFLEGQQWNTSAQELKNV
jgi:hypothetical protein